MRRKRWVWWIGLLCWGVGVCGTAANVGAQSVAPIGDPLQQGFFGGGDTQPLVFVSAEFTAATADQPAGLFVTASVQPGWHIYSMTQPKGGPLPTRITLDESDAYQLAGPSHVSPAPHVGKEPVAFPGLTIESHEGSATWYIPIELAESTDPAELQIEGNLEGLACKTSCQKVGPLSFTATLGQGMAIGDFQPAVSDPPGVTKLGEERRWVTPSPEPPTTAATPPPDASSPVFELPDNDYELPWRLYTTFDSFRALLGPSFDPDVLHKNVLKGTSGSSLGWMMFLAFVGGILLNLMPCVLPVIGLKVLAFVEQAGQDRRRALMLNIWYSAGLLSVFLLLATLAAFLHLGWGGLFKYPTFNIAMAAVIFSMALSFLGVWEIPIPGFVGSGKTAGAAEQEGLTGAFLKGIITTILATPCVGPYMATALVWALNQPPLHTYAVFTSIGLGMASPYLLVGAFPALLRFLPKPGAWMDTFKQIMGFVLLGTVCFIFTFLSWSYVVPTIGLLFAIWAGCWWVNRTPLTEDFGVKARAWLGAAAFISVAWLLLFPGINEMFPGRYTFGGLHDVMKHRFDNKTEYETLMHIERERQEGFEMVYTGRKQALPSGPNTVMVDFTANWCTTCKTMEATVLNTTEVRKLVDANGVIPLRVDCTEDVPENLQFLALMQADAVPVLVIFPANDPNNPTAIFRATYTQGQLLDALKRAGPSRGY